MVVECSAEHRFAVKIFWRSYSDTGWDFTSLRGVEKEKLKF